MLPYTYHFESQFSFWLQHSCFSMDNIIYNLKNANHIHIGKISLSFFVSNIFEGLFVGILLPCLFPPIVDVLPKMQNSEKLCLKWNDFQENLNSAFGVLRNDKEFSDVTLACEAVSYTHLTLPTILLV